MNHMQKKRLAVFCDGTWNEPSDVTKETNVVKLFEATLLCDGETPQITHYVKGVGTSFEERIRGGAFGYGISDNIKSGYAFLVANYTPGDEIYLFGFSRGAFTARSIAGLIRNVGVLTRDKMYLIDEAYAHYRDKTADWAPDGASAIEFRKDNAHPTECIDFIGVWDSVGALGSPYGVILGYLFDRLFHTSFHDVKLSSWVQSAYHALAADEKRWPFRPAQWELNAAHRARNAEAITTTGVPLYEEKWFPGVHSNVGGGYPDVALSDIALQWLAGRSAQRGLKFDAGKLSAPPLAPDIAAKPEESQTAFYRRMTKIFVYYPYKIGLIRRPLFPQEMVSLARYLTEDGDYIRPIDPVAGDVSELQRKKAADPNYHPRNLVPVDPPETPSTPAV
jgi:uncharacterized protein (DUF2235 family)